jgi:hypothetical protein
VRTGIHHRLVEAQAALPDGVRLLVIEGHRPVGLPEWWHWSYGDRYWAVVTGAPAALYAPR